MTLLIKNGRIINPATNMDCIKDLYIENGKVKKIDKNIDIKVRKIIDAKNCWVVPGLIDVHVHLREPGFEYKETIETGARSAAKGGFTTICAMPNTNPVIDNEILVEYIKLKAEKEAIVNVLPIGAITKGQKGEELANIGKMKKAGICAISEDGKSVMNASLLKKAMTYAKMFELPILSHCEDKTMAGNGCMNDGDTATLLGLKGIPDEAEEIIVSRDILLAKNTGAKLHLCHLSTKGSIEILKYAKEQGIKVTAEVCPHHFTLTDEDVDGYDTNTKMNPPLRTRKDVNKIKEALKLGLIDIIATDHAPHHIDDKNCTYEEAANGIVGLETAVSLTLTELYHEGHISAMDFVKLLSYNPAKMLNIKKGDISVGNTADVTIIQPDEEDIIDVNKFESKGKNSPFHNRKVKGKVYYTIVNGEIKYQI